MVYEGLMESVNRILMIEDNPADIMLLQMALEDASRDFLVRRR